MSSESPSAYSVCWTPPCWGLWSLCFVMLGVLCGLHLTQLQGVCVLGQGGGERKVLGHPSALIQPNASFKVAHEPCHHFPSHNAPFLPHTSFFTIHNGPAVPRASKRLPCLTKAHASLLQAPGKMSPLLGNLPLELPRVPTRSPNYSIDPASS